MEVGALLAGKYRLVRLLGDGGMGAVYEARHEALGSNFAIKILHADLARRPGLIERFLREAHVSAQIKSPHVVQVFDVDRTPPPESIAYIVMELLGGEPLARVLDRERKLSPPVAVGFALQMLDALASAHALGVVHRDLKPENVFLTPPPSSSSGAPPLLKLIDFGIAPLKSTDPQTKNLTAFGVVMGTPEYMAPEQAFSADRADARSDLYAVGVMLYEMLAGTRPALGEEAQVVAAKVHRGEIVALIHAAPEVPRELAGLVHRAMAPRPELRFQSATEMSAALRGILQHFTAAANAPSPSGMGVVPSTMLAPPIASPMPPGVITGAAGRTQAPDVQPAVSPGPPPYGYTPPPQVSYPEQDHYARARRKSRSPIGWIVGIPLILGAAAAAIVIGINQSSPKPSDPVATAVTPTPTNVPTTPGTTITTPAEVTPSPTSPPLPTLVPGQTPAPNRPPVAKPPVDASIGDAGAAAPTPSASVPPPIFPPFPSTFPSTLPFPFPSGIPLPSGFPPMPSGFPFPPPPPSN